MTHERKKSAATFKSKYKKKGLPVIIILLTFLLQIYILCNFFQTITETRIGDRALKEFQLKAFDQITLPAGIYSGRSDFGILQGNGSFSFSSGTIYTGSFLNDQIDGSGTLQLPSEGTYVGEFQNGEKNGKGIFTWNNGSIYEGFWLNDQMTGQGKYTSNAGTLYDGEFKENAFWKGVCTYTSSKDRYKLTYFSGHITNAEIQYEDGTTYNGDCKENGLSGQGIMSFYNGDLYEGSFSESRRNGEGIYRWSSGDYYEGNWVDDKFSGAGTYHFSDGSYLTGAFSDNQFSSGQYHMEMDADALTFTISYGSITGVDMTLQNGTHYDGEIESGEFTGQAEIRYTNGDQYEGMVSRGVKFGTGTYKWTSGAKYTGNWKYDKMDGTGTYFYPPDQTGYKLVGSFSEGLPDGQCEYYETSYRHYKTDWSKGSCIKIYE